MAYIDGSGTTIKLDAGSATAVVSLSEIKRTREAVRTTNTLSDGEEYRPSQLFKIEPFDVVFDYDAAAHAAWIAADADGSAHTVVVERDDGATLTFSTVIAGVSQGPFTPGATVQLKVTLQPSGDWTVA